MKEIWTQTDKQEECHVTAEAGIGVINVQVKEFQPLEATGSIAGIH